MNPADPVSVSPVQADDAPASVLQPEGALTAYTVTDWHAQFRAKIAGPGAILVDLGRITACDTLGLQLLCSIRRTARETTRAFAVVRVPQVVSDLARVVGLEAELFQEETIS